MTLRSFLAAAAIVLGGCAATAPQYAPVVANVDAAARLPGSLSVGKFELADPSLNHVTARGTSFESPVNGSYADFLASAARAELTAAGKYQEGAARVLTATVQKNSLSAAGINTNEAEVSVRFRLADGSRSHYDKTVSVQHAWESSFLGGIAIPRAIQNYVVALQMLLNKLFSDPEFASATRP